MKWELDLWYELWDRAGSQGLDTWHDPRGLGKEDVSPPNPDATTDGEPEEA